MNTEDLIRIKKQIVGLINTVKEDYDFEGSAYTWLDDTYACVFAYNDGVIYGKIAYNTDDLQCDYDVDWYMPCAKDGEVIDTEIGYPAEKFAELDPVSIAEEFVLNYYDMINALEHDKASETGSLGLENNKSEEILTEEEKQAQIDNLDISDLPDVPDAEPCTYQVWLIGYDDKDNANDYTEFVKEFADPDEAVKFAQQITDWTLPEGTASADVQVEEIVDMGPDADEIEVGVIYRSRL